MGDVLLPLLWFAAKWLLILGVSGYLALVICGIALQIVRRAAFCIRGVTALIIYFAAEAVIDLCFGRPLRYFGRKTRQPAVSGNPVAEARDVMGLPESFTTDDLKSRYRDLSKRLHPDTGGTEWLMKKLNWAQRMLEQHAEDSY